MGKNKRGRYFPGFDTNRDVPRLPGGDFRGYEGADFDGNKGDVNHRGWLANWDDKDRRNGPVVTYPAYNPKEDTTPYQPTGWNTGGKREIQCAKACDFSERSKNQEVHIVLSTQVQNAIDYLCRNIKIEWQMLLSGVVEVVEGIEYVRCNEYYIPKQIVGPAHVQNVDCIDQEFIATRQIIATIHSHANMSVFFSSTDEEDCCANTTIKYHMVTNNDNKYHAAKADALPCGMKKLVEAKVYLQMPERVRPTGFENIQDHRYGGGSLADTTED